MIAHIFKFGTGNLAEKDFPEGTSLGCMKNNEALRAALGYPQNVECRVGGITQPDNYVPTSSLTISIVSRACEKH